MGPGAAFDDQRLHTLTITVCDGCVMRRPGQCHEPECFYCRYDIEDVPPKLRHYVTDGLREQADAAILALADAAPPLDLGDR